jgi:hypothetical protein
MPAEFPAAWLVSHKARTAALIRKAGMPVRTAAMFLAETIFLLL